MTAEQSPLCQIPYLMPSQAQKHVTHNAAVSMIDALLEMAVLDRNLATPPGSPADGDRYIVAAPASGAWSGRSGQITYWSDGAWEFLSPRAGWTAWVVDEAAMVYFTGSDWATASSALSVLQNLALLGVGTTADATNPFSAKLNKALWTAKTAAEGGSGDLRYTLNKETAANVLSLLMQDGFSARAELGLIGGDDFTLKVSPDGSSWTTALTVDKSSGMLRAPGINNTPIGATTPAPGTFTTLAATSTATFGAGLTAQFPTALTIAATGHATSRRAALLLGDWLLEQDSSGTGTKNFAIYNGALANVMTIATSGYSTFGYGVTATGALGVESPALDASLNIVRPAGKYGIQNFKTGSIVRWAMYVDGGTESGGNSGSNLGLNCYDDSGVQIANVWSITRATGGINFKTAVYFSVPPQVVAYTVATLPSPAPAGRSAYCSDLNAPSGAAAGGMVISDGAKWRRSGEAGYGAYATDADFSPTMLYWPPDIRHTATLTANRTVTLPTTSAYPGARFRITRTGAGAFTLNVGGLKSLSTNTWAEFVYDGSAWYLTAYGAL